MYSCSQGNSALNKLPKIPKNLRSSLKEIIAMDDIDANEEAWSFRRQLDVIIEYKLPFISL